MGQPLRFAITHNLNADRRDLTREQYRRARRARRDFLWQCRQLADDEEPQSPPPRMRGTWTYLQTQVALSNEPSPRAALTRARIALSTKLSFGRLPARRPVERLPLPGAFGAPAWRHDRRAVHQGAAA
jgi:hypothetical protein